MLVRKKSTNQLADYHSSHEATEYDQGCKSRVHQGTSFCLTTRPEDQFVVSMLFRLGVNMPFCSTKNATWSFLVTEGLVRKNLRRLHPECDLFHDFDRRDLPSAIDDRGRGFLRPVEAQHQDEFVSWSRKPVRLLVGTGTLMLHVEID